MTRYFMRDTPLCQMEQQMMTPPYFKPRGHGRYPILSDLYDLIEEEFRTYDAGQHQLYTQKLL